MSYTEQELSKIWQKGKLIRNYDPRIWRRDDYGSCMKKSQHGDRKSKYGWEVDHIKSVADGGTDDLLNLRPLQWKNNVRRNG